MPLINENTVKVDIGEDWYILKKEIGFYDNTILSIDSLDPDELESFSVSKNGKEEEGVFKSKRTPGQIIASQNAQKLFAYISEWSHEDSLTLDNVKRIKPQDSRILIKKIGELEDSIPEPFQTDS